MLLRFLVLLNIIFFTSLSYAIHYSDKNIDPEMAHSTVSFSTYLGDCSGVMIQENVILTAAHCFESDNLKYIKLNTYLNSSKVNTSQVIYNVQVKRHPNFDLALIYLDTPLNSIKVANYLESLKTIFSKRRLGMVGGASYCFLGIGKTEEGINWKSTLGQACNQSVHITINSVILISNLLNEKQIVDTGDSGGPLFLQHHGRVFLVGIITIGTNYNGKRVAGAIDLYDEVISSWILDNVL